MRNEWSPITHSTLELAECRDKWTFDEQHGCWCLEDVLYTARADVPEFQRLSIFAPKALMNADGTPTRESKRIPVIFENSSAGYMQMPHTRLGESRCFAAPYLNHGFVYITCGCRGRESRGAQGELVGKAPMTLVDLKAAIRFLRHNQAALPGDFGKIISVGCSAGGAMSALLGVTGDNKSYEPYLKATGAFMEESDAVFASQIYCPITDLEHADLAYEWCFGADKECMDSHAGPAETMTPFKEALSKKLAARYVDYVNALGLRHPRTDAALTLNPDGRSGSFYDYLMDCISRSATDFLTRLQARSLPLPYSAEDYVSGQRAWLRWDGNNAVIDDLDAYVLHHRRRMKPCTSFDTLGMDSGENQVLGSANQDYMHFNPAIGAAIAELKDRFPDEAEAYADAYEAACEVALRRRVYLINPMNFIGTEEKSVQAKHYRIRVGASDADTSFSVAMTLAVRLQNAGFSVDYALVWDQPHTEADYPGEVLKWIDEICK